MDPLPLSSTRRAATVTPMLPAQEARDIMALSRAGAEDATSMLVPRRHLDMAAQNHTINQTFSTPPQAVTYPPVPPFTNEGLASPASPLRTYQFSVPIIINGYGVIDAADPIVGQSITSANVDFDVERQENSERARSLAHVFSRGGNRGSWTAGGAPRAANEEDLPINTGTRFGGPVAWNIILQVTSIIATIFFGVWQVTAG